MNLTGYKKHVISAHAPKPLTFAEEELELIKKNEVWPRAEFSIKFCSEGNDIVFQQVSVDISVDTKHQTVQGVIFPLSQPAIDQLKLFKTSCINYVQLVGFRHYNCN